MKKQGSFALKILSYILVAALASAATYFLCGGSSKLDALQTLLERRFIGEVDSAALEDAAAAAMVNALGDRWSYYVRAENYEALEERHKNAYVGIGISIKAREDGQGFDIFQVEPGGPALEAGILPGDILVEAEGQPVQSLSANQLQELIRGKEGTGVSISVLRNGQKLDFSLTRKTIQVQVVSAQMLPDNIGLIKINNFNVSRDFSWLFILFIYKHLIIFFSILV